MSTQTIEVIIEDLRATCCLDDLPGWPRTSRPTTAEAVAAIKKRLQWASIHWGTQNVSEDAWPHIADAVLNLWGAEANR